MWNLLSEARVRQLSVFWSALIIVGLFAASWIRVLPSIGIAGLFLTGVGYALRQRRIAQWQHWARWIPFTLVYLVHAATGLQHAGLADKALQQDLLLQLPFILLPVAFLLLPDWPAAYKRLLWLLLIGCCLVAAIGATINYLRHAAEIAQLYLQSKVMPTEPDHIRFSLLVSMAILAGVVLLFEGRLSFRWRQATLLSIVLLFLFQHLLAVRSGIVTLYAAGGLWLVWLGTQPGRWKAALTGAVLAAGVGVGCLLLFPTLQNKITNTRDDAEQWDSVRAANNFSVTARVYSYQVAWTVIRQHPLLGVSKIKLADAMAQQYSYRFPEIEPDRYVLPHNQFIYNLAAYGIIGLLLFTLGFYYPLLTGIRQHNMLVMLLYLIVSISFIVEYTLESNIGVIVGLFFILLAAAPTPPPRPSP
ncbi:O-antigen ligase family protein [Hymenobacter psoromatis]|uniref:O-antigen ligase family protein n=1 Tax=Hymenobacter psoromatis TaxID=1484116 RepID=UPI001CBE758E|nr:O-antigen ligase family protein [Hymenobacter psoromatis]